MLDIYIFMLTASAVFGAGGGGWRQEDLSTSVLKHATSDIAGRNTSS